MIFEIDAKEFGKHIGAAMALFSASEDRLINLTLAESKLIIRR